MILVDTSVWIDHFRRFNQSLYDLLVDGKILSHPFIVGELACGYLPDRAEILSLMQNLPAAEIIEHDVVLTLVEQKRLVGTGIGWIDAHLLASSMVMGCGLWSIDKPLAKAAVKMGIAAPSKTVP